MIFAFEQFLRSNWTMLLPDQPPPARVRVAVLTSSREATGTRILLVFGDRQLTPAMVAKVPRRPGTVAGLEQEWHLLRLLHETASPALRASIPVPLLATVVEGVPLYLQSAVTGQNLKTLMQRERRPMTPERVVQDIGQIERWLELFQANRPPRIDPPGLSVHRELEVLPRAEAAGRLLIDASILTRPQARALCERAEQIDRTGSSGEPCWVHGDLWPGNVMVDGADWRIIDWDGLTVGAPWTDRFWFALHYGMLAHSLLGHTDMGEGLRRTLFLTHPVSDAVGRYLRESIRGHGVTGLSARDYLELLLMLEAGRALRGEARLRIFVRMAPEVLHAWMLRPGDVRL